MWITLKTSRYQDSQRIVPIHVYWAQEAASVLVVETLCYFDVRVKARKSLLGHIFHIVEDHVNNVGVEVVCAGLASIVLTVLHLGYEWSSKFHETMT